MGIRDVEDIASTTISEATDYTVIFKSVKVEVPVIKFQEKDIVPRYSFYKTNSAMDIAYTKFNKIRYLIYTLAQVECSI